MRVVRASFFELLADTAIFDNCLNTNQNVG